MPKDSPPYKDDNMLFANLVMMLSTSAMQALGKLVSPISGKTEVNLEAAQISIDTLEMLREKTKGNLEVSEKRLIDDVLSMLQLNYVETSGSKPPEEAAASATEPKAEEPEPKKDEKDPKFHKTYGE